MTYCEHIKLPNGVKSLHSSMGVKLDGEGSSLLLAHVSSFWGWVVGSYLYF